MGEQDMRMHSNSIGPFAKGVAIAAMMTASTGAFAQSAPQPITPSFNGEYTSPIIDNAQNIRSLNIMLMVTSLRCRTSGHDFRGEYELFAAAHRQNLEEASQHLTHNLVASHGEDGSHRELDRMGVAIANQYGDGHPTMGCPELKQATLELAMSQDRAQLAAMAGRLLDEKADAPLVAHWNAASRPGQSAPSVQSPPQVETQFSDAPQAVAPSEQGNRNPGEPEARQSTSTHQNPAKARRALNEPQAMSDDGGQAEQSDRERVPNWLRG
ncbi:MAG: hypothetical protein ABJN35_04895 [Erythrobacter sp.]